MKNEAHLSLRTFRKKRGGRKKKSVNLESLFTSKTLILEKKKKVQI